MIYLGWTAYRATVSSSSSLSVVPRKCRSTCGPGLVLQDSVPLDLGSLPLFLISAVAALKAWAKIGGSSCRGEMSLIRRISRVSNMANKVKDCHQNTCQRGRHWGPPKSVSISQRKLGVPVFRAQSPPAGSETHPFLMSLRGSQYCSNYRTILTEHSFLLPWGWRAIFSLTDGPLSFPSLYQHTWESYKKKRFTSAQSRRRSCL